MLLLAAMGRAALGRIGKLADGAEAGAREASAAGDTAKAARLSEQASRYRQAISLARGGKAGTALRDAQAQAAEKLSAKAKASLAKGQAAVAKQRERKRSEQGRKLQAQRMASPEEMQARWRNQTSGQVSGHGQPALAHASEAPGGDSTRAIGKPEGNPCVMQRVDLIY